MDSDRLNRWMTLGANIGVLAGIIFLAFELQQNTVATQLEAASNFQDSFSEIELFIAGSPEFAELLRKGREGEEIPDIDAAPHDYEVRCWDMQPGDAIVFSAEIVHGARENMDTSRRRAALSIRYIGDDARWYPTEGTDPIVTPERVGINPGEPPHNEQWFPLVWSAN